LPLAELTAENALIFRITHKDNLPWILDNGLHCRNSKKQDPSFVNIGLTEMIDKRRSWHVLCKPGGTLSDYVPFYFTPRSMSVQHSYGTERTPEEQRGDCHSRNFSSTSSRRWCSVPHHRYWCREIDCCASFSSRACAPVLSSRLRVHDARNLQAGVNGVGLKCST
jgi:hypothetical protein